MSPRKTHVLVDLKPALDGYAGIPQESRLLFSTLLGNPRFEAHGLLQHGGDRLRAELSVKDKDIAAHEKLAKLSRSVISFDGPARKLLPLKWSKGLSNYIDLNRLRLASLRGKAEELGLFEATHFQDFIWSRFFAKTLEPAQKKAVTNANYRILRPSRKTMHKVGLTAHNTRYGLPYPRIDTTGYDYLIAQTPFPGRVSPGTQLIVRYHDAIPVFLPHTISDRHFHQASHYEALKQNVKDGALFACISHSTRNDLLQLFPEVETRSAVINNTIAEEYFAEESPKHTVFSTLLDRAYKDSQFIPNLDAIHERINTRNSDDFDYLLMVSTLEPRKNHLQLIAAWEQLKQSTLPHLKLIIVGSKGWGYTPTLKAMQPWVERGELHYLHNVPAPELRRLYRHASATICPSLAEGFDYSGIEAIRCGSPIVSSDIAVHREIYGEASTYFDPYNTDDAAEKIAATLASSPNSERQQQANTVMDRYTQTIIAPQWEQLMTKHANTEGHGRPTTQHPGI